MQSKRRLGDQTTTYVTRLPAGDARAHDLVGVIVPFDALARLRPELRRGLVAVPFGGEAFDWLGWTDPPAALREVHVAVMKVERMAPPCAAMPILQSHLDLIVEAALRHVCPHKDPNTQTGQAPAGPNGHANHRRPARRSRWRGKRTRRCT